MAPAYQKSQGAVFMLPEEGHLRSMGAHRNFSREGQGTDDMASAGVRAYNGGLEAEPPAGSRGRAPGQGSGAKPPEAEHFEPFAHLKKSNFPVFRGQVLSSGGQVSPCPCLWAPMLRSSEQSVGLDCAAQSINQSIRTLMQVDKPQRDRVNEYITVQR